MFDIITIEENHLVIEQWFFVLLIIGLLLFKISNSKLDKQNKWLSKRPFLKALVAIF